MSGFKIPGGRDRGIPLPQADEKAIKWWLNKYEQELKADPNGQYAAANTRWIEAAKAELARRARDGGPAPAPQAIQKQAPAGVQLLGSSMHDASAVTAKLGELATAYHLVSPASSVDAMPAGCGIALSFLTVDPNDGKDGPGDVYSVGGGKVGLSATTLSKIGGAAGISWDPKLSGRLDDGSDPHYCHYRAVGKTRNFDGSVRVLTGEVEIDAREGSPQIDEIRQKAAARESEPDYRGKKDGGAAQILELRKFLLRHAERKAKSRAIADLGVKRSYTKAELQKPFAVANLMFTGQTDDPVLRRVFAERIADSMLGATAALYGAPERAALPAAAPAVGHPPPPLDERETFDTSGDDAPPDAEDYGAPTPEELEEERRSMEEHS